MNNLFFDSWDSLSRTIVSGILAYAGLLILLRISGKRTLSKLNAFDLVITVALGSTLSTILIDKNVAILDGIVALGLLILFQFIITWFSVRSDKVDRVVKSTPSVLYHKGRFIDAVMKSERVTKDEILAAARQNGLENIEDAIAVILETDGSLSVLKNV